MNKILAERVKSWSAQLFLQRAPQDDSLSPAVLWLALAAYLLVDVLQAVSSSTASVAVAMSLVDTLLLVVYSWGVLMIASRRARLVQTLTALAGTGALLGVIGLPLIRQAAEAHRVDAGPSAMMVFAWLGLLAWNVSVQAHIFRHALSARYGLGLLVAGIHTVLAIAILESMFPRVIDGN